MPKSRDMNEEAEYELGYKAGVENEKARIVKYILDTAAEYFCLGKDEQAQELRKLANGLSPRK